MLRPALLCATLLCATQLYSAPLRAEPLQDGVAAWLKGDDATALPLLVTAARQGDTRAMLLLGALEMRGLPFAGEEEMSEDARAAIFDAPGDAAQSWLDRALTTDAADRARPLAAMAHAENDAASLGALIAQGEVGLATRMSLALITQDPAAIVAVASRPDLPDALVPWTWIAAARVLATAPEDPAAQALLDQAQSAPDSLMRRVFLSYGGDRALGLDPANPDSDLNRLLREGEAFSLMEGWTPDMASAMEPVLVAAPETAALSGLCTASCPTDPGGCTRALYDAAGGIFGAVALQSPLADAIPEESYLRSPRLLADLRALAGITPRDRIVPSDGTACAFGLLDGRPDPG